MAAIRITGLNELNRAFSKAGRDVSRQMRLAERSVAEPVRVDAEHRAVREISGLRREAARGRAPWSEMRVGQSGSIVYVAPKQRGRKSKKNRALRRPNMADLLMKKAMEPALDANKNRVEANFARFLDRVADDFNR